MKDIYDDHSKLDIPEVLMCLFHPRREGWGEQSKSAHEKQLLVPVDGEHLIGMKLYMSKPHHPVILFFHGNGEIVSDYDDIARFYMNHDINFLAAGYRGYGKSTGEPTVSDLMQDSNAIFIYVRRWLEIHGYDGPVIVMGRSLGSAPALEIANKHQDAISGLIIESGFAYTMSLFTTLGIDIDYLGLTEKDGFGQVEKIKKNSNPLLVIHGEHDSIIPASDGETLYRECPAINKHLLRIKHAGHNTVMTVNPELYFNSIKEFVLSVM